MGIPALPGISSEMSGMVIETSTSSTVIDEKMRKEMETWKGRYMMTSWENYEDFLEKLGVGLLLRKLATLGTPIVEVTEENGEWNIRRTTTIFYRLVKLSSIVTVEGNKFIHKSTAKVEGVTGHTVITEFCGDKVTRYMTIDKVPDCIGVMKFERVKEGEERETKEVDLQD